VEEGETVKGGGRYERMEGRNGCSLRWQGVVRSKWGNEEDIGRSKSGLRCQNPES
jgi:hypothetical protein